MKLYFVRHGESTANLSREFSNSGLKHPLTETGIDQALALARDLSDVQIDRVYSSPVLRALQTAAIIGESQAIQVSISEALREWSVGIYEGTSDSTGWNLHRQVQEDWFERQQLDSKMPGGESFNEIRARFVPFIVELLRVENSARSIVLVSHGGLYVAMLPSILTNIDYAFALEHGLPYTGCVSAETRSNGLHCLTWCGISVGA